MGINGDGPDQSTEGSALASTNGETQKTVTQERVLPPPFSVFSKFEKGLYIYVASLAAFASPVSSSIYYPAMNTLAEDLHTSLTNISLTVTTYLVPSHALPLYFLRKTSNYDYDRYFKVYHLP